MKETKPNIRREIYLLGTVCDFYNSYNVSPPIGQNIMCFLGTVVGNDWFLRGNNKGIE